MLEIQIKTKLPENCALGTIKEISKSSVMKVEGITRIDGGVKGLLRIKAEKIESLIPNLPSYCEGITVSSKEAKVLIKDHTCLTSIPILESGCIITSVKVEDETIIWNVICDDDSFLSLLRKLDEYRVDYEILYKSKPSDKTEITYREEEILKIALEKGFFDFPRKIKLEDLAKDLGIKPSTLSEIIRRGLKKILKRYFTE